MFTPIQAVRVDIENVRVGQMTDWDKLIIDITTDGTIEYTQAFQLAIDILVEQFSFLQEHAAQSDDAGKKSKKVKKSESKAQESQSAQKDSEV